MSQLLDSSFLGGHRDLTIQMAEGFFQFETTIDALPITPCRMFQMCFCLLLRHSHLRLLKVAASLNKIVHQCNARDSIVSCCSLQGDSPHMQRCYNNYLFLSLVAWRPSDVSSVSQAWIYSDYCQHAERDFSHHNY